jgi:2,3-bisphosphoglycerate-dependent phosphoglycerate mutase
MNRTLLIFVFLLLAEAIQAQTNQITTFILVRHAEKADDGTTDPDLKPEGIERARRLGSLLKNTSIDAIYSTKYKRTKNTVSVLAGEKGLDVQVYESVKPEFIDELLARYSGKTILVGGHSNTTPQIANLLLGKEEFKTFPDSEYGNILIISVVEKANVVKIVRLNY